MAEAYIVAATRTAGGRKGGRVRGWHPADLAAVTLNELMDRTGVDPAAVEDVHAFPGHIACDSRSASEIVVPVFDAAGELIAVFDVDSEVRAAFDDVDREWLERILAATFGSSFPA